MSGEALHRLFGSELVLGVQLPQNRGLLGFTALLCADERRAARRAVWRQLSSQLCVGALRALQHLAPGWSRGAASLETAFMISLEAETICSGLQV